MPEGPEVYSLALELDYFFSGLDITDIISSKFQNQIEKLELPATVLKVSYLSKKIIWELSTGQYLVSFLGMSGGWSLKKDKYSLLEIITEQGSVFYSDVRRFGRFNITDNLDTIFKNKGPDWVLNQVSFEYFKNLILKKENNQICKFLMDTKNTTGIGNYIKSEALFLSGIDPRRTCKNITLDEIKLLYDNIKKVIHTSVKAGGFTQRDYFSLYGKPGKYEPHIYGFTSKNGFPVLKGTFDDKRTSWYCPEYQT